MRPNSPKSFVGRDSELSTLNELLERSTHGQGQIAFVTGDAGIGKTHLVTEFGRQARRRQVEVVSGRARELGGAPPYSLWIPLLTDLFGFAMMVPGIRRSFVKQFKVRIPQGFTTSTGFQAGSSDSRKRDDDVIDV